MALAEINFVRRVTHSIGDGGFVTSLKLEMRDEPVTACHRSSAIT